MFFQRISRVEAAEQSTSHNKKGAISTFKTRSSQTNGNFKVQDAVESVNPLTPTSDRHETSPCGVITLSGRQVVGVFKLIR